MDWQFGLKVEALPPNGHTYCSDALCAKIIYANQKDRFAMSEYAQIPSNLNTDCHCHLADKLSYN